MPVLVSAVFLAMVVIVIAFGGKLSSIKEQDRVAYPLHVAAGTLLQRLGASPSMIAEQWLKAGYHARSDAETDITVQGLRSAVEGVQSDELDHSLCSIFHESPPSGWANGVWPNALRDQFAILGSLGLSCPDATIWGQVPDDLPIAYDANPPTTGIFHATWYPTYGVATEPVPSSTWLHNVAHGGVVLLYHCPDGCPELVAQANDLGSTLSPDRNPRFGVPRLLVTASDEINSPIALVTWGKLLELNAFDPDQIVAFFEENVDHGPECNSNLYCPD
jgi:hypothetical protein